jgi:hypothetical protein
MNAREKRLLAACGAVIFIAGATVVAKEYLDKSDAVNKRIAQLQGEKKDAETWIQDRAFQEKHAKWLDEMMPKTDSLGRSQGELLDELDNAAQDRNIKVLKRTPNEPTKTEYYQEVSVGMQFRGESSVMMEWLATLQSPELFQVIKAIEIEPDTRAKEKTPQCFVTMTVARWFKPEGT